MVPRVLLVTALLVALPLAGCIGGDDVTPAADSDEDVPTTNATCADGCNLAAIEETTAVEEGAGGVDHHHDYWNGALRLTIFQTEAMMNPLGSGNAESYKAEATFKPPQTKPDGADVPPMILEATETVEFTAYEPQRHVCEGEFTLGGFFVCHDNLDQHVTGAPALPAPEDPTGGPTGLKLRYKHASTTQWIEAGEITWGQPVPIKITHPTQTDMPHSTSSSWEFQVVSPNAYDTTLEFKAKAEIIRGVGDVPLWPGHPNFYSETTARKVLELDAVACDTNACKLPDAEKAGPVTSQRLISYGTRTLFVWLNITDVFAPNPALAPTNWFLWHWNSTGNDNITDVFDTENHGFETKSHMFILPVDDNGMDSPYADGSRWKFQLGGALQSALSCYGGCADWWAKYHIDVIASSIVLPADQYDMYCLRDDYCPSPEDAESSPRQSPAPDAPRAPAPSADRLVLARTR